MGNGNNGRDGAGPYSKNYVTDAKRQTGPIAKYLASPEQQAAVWPKITKYIDKDEGRKGFKGVGIDGKNQQGGLPKFRNRKDWA